MFHGLSKKEERIFNALSNPAKLQDFLNAIPINFEEKGDTCYSPRKVLAENTAQCLEGAIFAAAVLYCHGQKPLLLDLRSEDPDTDHVVALFKRNDRWGAVSKTNHAVLRYREPVYRTVRELAMSYFHEYFMDNGYKTMRDFSRPFDLSRYDKKGWITTEENLWYIRDGLDASPHEKILTSKTKKELRRTDDIEIEAGKLIEWKPSKK